MYTTHDFKGIGEVLRTTHKPNGAVVAADIGKSAVFTAAGLVDVGGADDVLHGLIEQVNGDDITVAIEGIVEFVYTGTAPTGFAWNKLECAAAGKIQVDATNGREYYVLSVNTSNTTCLVKLKK